MIEIDENAAMHEVEDQLIELVQEELKDIWYGLDFGMKMEIGSRAKGCIKEDEKNNKKKFIDIECIKRLAVRIRQEHEIIMEQRRKEEQKQNESLFTR